MRRPLMVAPLALIAVAGCGGGSAGKSTSDSVPAQPKPTASATAFPSAKGKTLDSLRAGLPEGPILAPSTTSSLGVGNNRVGFALFTPDRRFVTNAAVALYTTKHDGSDVRGPFVARLESLAVSPPYQSKTTAADPDSAKSVYVADVTFPRAGKAAVMALVRLDGRLLHTNAYGAEVGRAGAQPPGPGEQAIKVDTLTLADVGGDASKISTRTPPADDLLQTNLASVLGKQPVVITFATPLLCQSKVCGPVVDIVEQVKATAPKDVAFIHQEIYNDNQVNKGFRPQVLAWHLPTEPWTFVIDRHGRVANRFEGAVSVGELERAIAKVS